MTAGGVAWVQSRGSEKVEVYPGQTIYCPPGEEHWHGAADDIFMEHLAMLDVGADPATTTTWLEHVTEAEYRARSVGVEDDDDLAVEFAGGGLNVDRGEVAE